MPRERGTDRRRGHFPFVVGVVAAVGVLGEVGVEECAVEGTVGGVVGGTDGGIVGVTSFFGCGGQWWTRPPGQKIAAATTAIPTTTTVVTTRCGG